MPDKTLPPEPPTTGETDARLDRFLQRAAPVIAEERGFTSRSLVKLESIAVDMHLPEDLYNQAIHMLQGAPPVVNKPSDRWVEAFRQYIYAKLEQAPEGIVSAQMETRAIEVAATRFHLTTEQAQQTIRDVAKERGVRRVSQSEAERHVTDLIREKVGDAAWLDEATTARLLAEGGQWGISPVQAGAIIRRFTSENQQRQRRERRTVMLYLTAAGLVAAVLIGFFVYISIPDEETSVGSPDKTLAPVERRPPNTNPSRREFKPPEWWEEVGMAATAVRARLELPEFDKFFYQLGSPDATQRIAAYEGLIRLYEDHVENSRHRELLREIFSAIHAGESDDDAAQRLREGLLGLATVDIGEMVVSKRDYILAFWAVHDAIAMFDNGRLSDERASELEMAIGRVTGVSADRRLQRITLQRRCLWSVARRFYLQLIEKGSAEPMLAATLYAELYSLSARYAPNTEDLATLEAQLMAAIVPSAGRNWFRFQSLIERCIVSKDPLNVLKVVEVFERSQHHDLQVFIVERLLPQVRAAPAGDSVEDIAAAVRESLGVQPPAVPKTARQRWTVLEEKVQRALSSLTSGEDSEPLLNDSIEIAYLATLACALAQHEPGFAIFDQMIEEGPPENKNVPVIADVGRRVLRGPADAAKVEDLEQSVASLRNFADVKLPQRTTAIRALARLTDYIEDIQPDQASAIAGYLLARKSEEFEHERIVEAVVPLRLWTHVLIALADQMPNATLTKPQIQELLAVLLDRQDLSFDMGSNWKRSASNMLLQIAVNDLSGRHGVLADPAKSFDDAEVNLLGLYQTRGALLEAATHTAESPSQMLEALVQRTVGKLRSGSLPAVDKRWLNAMPYRSAVVEYLGHDDLRRTVLMQREWLKALAIGVARDDSQRGSRASGLVSQLEQEDARATNLLEQLRSGEVATLKLWMLLAHE